MARHSELIVFISGSEEDELMFRRIVSARHPVLCVQEVAEAYAAINARHPPVVFCDADAKGVQSWRDLADVRDHLSFALVVFSRCADARLWAEVLNLGGYDVLATPFRPQEVDWVLSSALRYARGR